MHRESWNDSGRAMVFHELLDLGLRCVQAPHDLDLAKRFSQVAAPLTRVLVDRLRILENENELLRSGRNPDDEIPSVRREHRRAVS